MAVPSSPTDLPSVEVLGEEGRRPTCTAEPIRLVWWLLEWRIWCEGVVLSYPVCQSLLQSVIRNLVDSEDDQERKAQRMKLESDLEMTSERLDALVLGAYSCVVWCGRGWGREESSSTITIFVAVRTQRQTPWHALNV